MSDEDELHPTLQQDYWLAEGVRMQINEFPEKFQEIQECGQLRRVLQDKKEISGPVIRQTPEQFTETQLIEPVLEGLGYQDPDSESYIQGNPYYIKRPTTYDKIEPRRPDYLLKDIAPSVVCIVESKAANRERMSGAKQAATDDIRDYLEEDTFCKYLHDIEQRYLVGIGTDGLRWTLWMKDLKTRETRESSPKVDISPVVEQSAIRLGAIEQKVSAGVDTDRQKLLKKFIPSFAAKNLHTHIKTQFVD